MALNRNCYPILEINESSQQLVCDNNGARFISSLDHFNSSTKKVLERVYQDIRKRTLRDSRETAKLRFLATFQFVYCQSGFKATLIKRTLETFDRREYRLHTILGVTPDGTIDCQTPIFGAYSEFIEWKKTRFQLWEITDRLCYEHLRTLVDEIQNHQLRGRKAKLWIDSLLDELLGDFEYVGVRGGEVRLILRRYS